MRLKLLHTNKHTRTQGVGAGDGLQTTSSAMSKTDPAVLSLCPCVPGSRPVPGTPSSSPWLPWEVQWGGSEGCSPRQGTQFRYPGEGVPDAG